MLVLTLSPPHLVTSSGTRMPPMQRLAFSTNAFKKNTLADAVDAIAAIGYRGVEIMADVPHALPARFSRDERDALKRQLASRNLAVSNVNAFTHFANGD